MHLKDYRKLRGITLAAVAGELGTTPSVISRYERGRVPDPAMMRRLIGWSRGAVQPNDFFADALKEAGK